jgi:hypothetical protein
MRFMLTQSGDSTRSAAVDIATSPRAKIAAAKAAAMTIVAFIILIVAFIILFQVVICEQLFITTSRYEEILS